MKEAAFRYAYGMVQITILYGFGKAHPPSGIYQENISLMKKFDYDQIYSFGNLYRAYIASRKNKRSTREVIQFEIDAGINLCEIQKELRDGTYRLSGYYHFTIYDPKLREI